LVVGYGCFQDQVTAIENFGLDGNAMLRGVFLPPFISDGIIPVKKSSCIGIAHVAIAMCFWCL